MEIHREKRNKKKRKHRSKNAPSSISTESIINFDFLENVNESINDNFSVETKDIDSENENEYDDGYNEKDDPAYNPKASKLQTQYILKLSKEEKMKELLDILSKSFELIEIIQGRLKDSSADTEKIDCSMALFSGGILRPYQVTGYEWIVSLYGNGLSGILADEMGLGKTVQVIAYMCYLIETGIKGPYFIVAPLSTLSNWINEFKRFAPTIPVMMYYGNDRFKMLQHYELFNIKINDKTYAAVYPIIITSYEIALRDATIFKDINFSSIILDEGQKIKNHNCKLIQALRKYSSDLRLILTGTPLQNDLIELWSLLYYIMPEVFNAMDAFVDWFKLAASQDLFKNQVLQEEEERALITTIHKIISPFILRRMKNEVEVVIPPKREIIFSINLTQKQSILYNAAIEKMIRLEKNNKKPMPDKNKSRAKSNDHIRPVMYDKYEQMADKYFDNLIFNTENVNDNNSEICLLSTPVGSFKQQMKTSNMMSLLRKIANHPYLVYYPLDEQGDYQIDAEIVYISSKMILIDHLLDILLKQQHKVLIFSQFNGMLDILQDYCNMRSYKYSRLDGRLSYTEREEQIHWFRTESEINIFLLNTRAGGLGLNLEAADTVILYDSDWNPQCDLQAQARCHRFGQTHPVLIIRLVVNNTVDRIMLDKAQVKRSLEKTILHDKKFKGAFFSSIDKSEREETKDTEFNQHTYNIDTKSFNMMTRDEMVNVLTERPPEIQLSADNINKDQLLYALDRSELYAKYDHSKLSNQLNESKQLDLQRLNQKNESSLISQRIDEIYAEIMLKIFPFENINCDVSPSNSNMSYSASDGYNQDDYVYMYSDNESKIQLSDPMDYQDNTNLEINSCNNNIGQDKYQLQLNNKHHEEHTDSSNTSNLVDSVKMQSLVS